MISAESELHGVLLEAIKSELVRAESAQLDAIAAAVLDALLLSDGLSGWMVAQGTVHRVIEISWQDVNEDGATYTVYTQRN